MTALTAAFLSPTANHVSNPRGFLLALYEAAVQRALPLHNTAGYLPKPPTKESGGRTIVLGAGKAGGAMAQAVEAYWPADAPLEGLVVTRYHHTPPRPAGLKQRIEVVEASHPVPDAACGARRDLAVVGDILATSCPVRYYQTSSFFRYPPRG